MRKTNLLGWLWLAMAVVALFAGNQLLGGFCMVISSVWAAAEYVVDALGGGKPKPGRVDQRNCVAGGDIVGGDLIRRGTPPRMAK